MEETNSNNKGQEASHGQIQLQIRTARMQKFISVDQDIEVKDLRVQVAREFEVEEPSLTVLIFGGKILKDSENLKKHDIKDGQTIHLVIRTKPSGESSDQSGDPLQQSTTNSTTSNSSASPSNAGTQGANPLLANLGDVQQRLQQMLISNPDSMQNMINPMMQQMMQNPEMIRNLFGSMQRMQSLMDRNPEMNHLLSNPDVLRESLEMVRNPAALQEVMRNYDRALNNMESMPGGYNVLRRMYTEFQEPLLSAFQEQFNNNQFNAATSPNTTTIDDGNQGEQQGTENRDPLPNPWASTTGSNQGNSNPNIRSSSTNPESSTISTNNATNILQQATNMMQNPEMLSLLTNPEAIQSLEQIQQGYLSLQRIAPSLFGNQPIPQFPTRLLSGMNARSASSESPMNNANASDSTTTPSQEMIESILRMIGPGLSASTNQPLAPQPNMDDPSSSPDNFRLLSQLIGTGGSNPGTETTLTQGGTQSQNPEERYSHQLQVLNDMGFTNREANLQVLIATFGDINAAIARLLPQ